MTFVDGDRVYWDHLPGRRRFGTVSDIDGTIGVRCDDSPRDGLVYVEAEHLNKIDHPAKDDPIHTVRRSITNWGFAHAIKLDQGQPLPAHGLERSDLRRDVPCWLIIDAYGPMDSIDRDGGFITDAQMDREHYEVVYRPADDVEWSHAHGLKDPVDCVCGKQRHDQSVDECASYYPDESQIGPW